MAREWTEALSTLHATEDGRALEGIIVPYGVVTGDDRRHGFAPGAFAASVEHWMSRTDGARIGFRLQHGARPVGTAPELRDTPEGVWARIELLDNADAKSYAQEVAAGLNGVSVEAGNMVGTRSRDGSTIYRKATLHAIAGSVSPAFEGARVSLHDMEEPVDKIDETPKPPEPDPEPAPPAAVTQAPRLEAERQAVASYSGIVQTRPEFIYKPGSTHTFLSDGYKASRGDNEAYDRQERHYSMLGDLTVTENYAGDVVVAEIPGAYPNQYLPGLLVTRIMKNRPMAGFFSRVGINDAQPKIYPQVTTSTSVAVQSAELVNPAASDFATTAITVTPALYGAETVVSRQVLDGSSPNAESMILEDMLQAYAQASETVVKTAVEAGATASGQAITAATPFAGLIANIVAYSVARFDNAEAQFIPSALWAVAAKQPDTGSLRPLLSPINPQNAAGTLTGGTLGAQLLTADVFHSYASTTNVVVTARRSDYVVFESNIARFSYDAVTGPAGIRVGLWAYLAAGKRLGGLSVTAA